MGSFGGSRGEEVEGDGGGNDDGDRKATGRGGTWKHAAFHVATTIATPAAYAALPFALSSLGWPLGVCSLVVATLATWYTSLLVASLWGWNGTKQTTYRSLARSIFGSSGYWFIAFFQQIASLGNNIAIHIAAGSSLKAIYKNYHPDGPLTLQHFIILFGAFELFLSQFPDIHSLRWINGFCTLCTVGFSATTISNIRDPAKKNMYKGVSAAYGVIILSYWLLAFLGYWAFGSNVKPYIVSSLTGPKWAVVMANLFAVVQISGCFQIYCRPTFAYFEERMLEPPKQDGHFLSLKRLLRLIFTSAYIVVITLTAAAMPFFGDFVAICGAVGFTPLDFVFPAIAFLKAGRVMNKGPVTRVLVVGLNVAIVVVFSVVAVLGCVGAVRFITEDVRTYKFFHDM